MRKRPGSLMHQPILFCVLSHHAVFLFEVGYKWFFDDPLQCDLDLLMAGVYRFYEYGVNAETGASDDICIYLIANCQGVVHGAADLVHGSHVSFLGRFSRFIYVIYLHLFVKCGNSWLLVVGDEADFETDGLQLLHELYGAGCCRFVMAHKRVVDVKQNTPVSHIVVFLEIYFVCG